MTLLLASRILALIIATVAVIRALPTGPHAFLVLLQCGIACLLIWIPATIDDWTFGTTRAGYRIDSHTPAWMIAAIGWLLLFLYVVLSWKPDLISRLFGM